MNGEMAIELAEEENINAKSLIMYDDIASAPKGKESERRGGAGTTFIYKIIGALSEQSNDLDSILSMGSYARDNTRTLSVAISSGVSPLSGEKFLKLQMMRYSLVWVYMVNQVMVGKKLTHQKILYLLC